MPTVYGRTVWQDPNLPVKGPPLPWPKITTISPHYTAAVNLIDGDPGEYQTNIPAYLRAIQRDYMNRKPTGYSIGYSWVVDWLGGIWEARGWDIKSAAQGFPLNDTTVAVLFLVDGNDEPTVEAMESFRYLNGQARKLAAGRKLRVMDHGRLPGAATGCAGTGIRRVVDLGWLDDEYTPNLPAPLPDGDTRMLVVVGLEENHSDPRRWLWDGISVRLLKSEQEFNRVALIFQLHPNWQTLASPFWMTQAEIDDYSRAS